MLKSIEGKQTGVFNTLVGVDDSGEGHMTGIFQLNKNGWGTKWDVLGCDIQPSYDEDLILIDWFETAWSPPIGFCQMLSKKYGVKCEIEYEEPGNDFCGKNTIDNGVITNEEEYRYREGKFKLDPEGFWYEVESDIETNIDDYETGEEFFEDNYKDSTYLDEDDKREIIRMFNDTKQEK